MGVLEHGQDRALYEVKEFLISIMANSPYGILAFDFEGEIIMTNALGIEYLGGNMSVNKAISRNILQFTEDIPPLKNVIDTYLRIMPY